ncbi:MAG: hypothetical protein ABL903_08335 [Methylococcales bacterium]
MTDKADSLKNALGQNVPLGDGLGLYILDGHTPVACKDALTFGKWFEKAERHVAKTVISDATISTVFLGVDHNFFGGKPLLFEAMIFGGAHNQEMRRCSTWEEAEKMHEAMCEQASTPNAELYDNNVV